jgi:APA family basic amino acid/polyamine antiporter
MNQNQQNGHHTPDGTSGGQKVGLARRLGPFDATMIVMGGIIGSGIFMNPAVVARIVHTPFLILGAWLAGGVIALLGAFIYAELAARRPQVGGQYAYLREAYNPLVAFVFGWTLFLISDCGGMAAVAVTFGRYFIELSGAVLPDWSIAVIAIAILTGINCLGVREGGTVQNILMVTKIAAVLMLVGVGFTSSGAPASAQTIAPQSAMSFDFVSTFGAALVPVMFAFGGWQTANFIAGEIKQPEKNLPRGLLIGVLGVLALYLSVNYVCLSVLGAEGLAATSTPASAVMRATLGEPGAKLIAIGIAISTLGFLSQSILTAPRVYFAMADDRLFFKKIAWIHPRTRVPVFAIIAQGALAILIALWGKYDQILSYVVWNDFCFFGLTASCLFILRKRARQGGDITAHRMPGHPFTTGLFILACVFIVMNTIYQYPAQAGIGLAVTLTGIPVYYFWRWRNRDGSVSELQTPGRQ